MKTGNPDFHFTRTDLTIIQQEYHMKKLFQKTLIAAALALPVLASATDTITFDMNGGGAGQLFSVDVLDWLPGNALSVGGNPVGGLQVGNTTQLLYQANLGSAVLGQTAVATAGLNGAQSFTAVAGVNEVVLTAGPNATFGFNDTAVRDASNFFYIYANQVGSNLSGLGFASAGGTLVMSGYISNVISSNFTATLDVNGNPVIAPRLDNFGTDNYPAIDTLVGSGSSDIDVVIDFANQAYFPGLAVGGVFSFAFFNSSQVTPFSQADPSACFSSDGVAGGAACSVAHNLGTINGVRVAGDTASHNFQFQADANMSFAQDVPEPGSLALVGLALGVVGFVGRRNNKKA